ncbi:MAG: ATP-binding cassette domain-containing protein [Siculibacillus sp.]|nr:ATP-binding cassette domain-containing protein [Siculibacillus sp.]
MSGIDHTTGATGWREGGSLSPLALAAGVAAVVRRGTWDVFAVSAGVAAGRRRFLFRVDPGDLLLGPCREGGDIELIAVGGVDSACEIVDAGHSSDAAMGAWIERLVVATLPAPPPGRSDPAAAGEIRVEAGTVIHVETGRHLVLEVTAGEVHLADRRTLRSGERVLLVGGAWLRALADCRLAFTPAADETASLRAGLEDACLAALADRRDRERESDRAAAVALAERDRRMLDGSLARLAGTIDPALGRCGDGDDFALVAGALLAALGVDETERLAALGESDHGDTFEQLDRVVKRLGLGWRRVRLDADAATDSGHPLLALRTADGRPVALLPRGGGWDIVDAEGTRPARAADFAGLDRDAHELHAALPPGPIGFLTFLRFGAIGAGADRMRAGIAFTLTAAAALALPFGAHHVVARVIPDGRLEALALVAAALAAAAIAEMVFDVFESLAVMRLQGRFALRSQSALMNRLLALPLAVHRAHTVGDLTDRVLGIEEANSRLSGALLSVVLGGAFGLVSLIPLVVLDLRLALFAVVVTALVCLILALLARAQLHEERDVRRLQGALDGFVLQMIRGISKLRTAAAEARAMSRWADAFARRRARSAVARSWGGRLRVAATVLPTLAGAALYGAIGFGAASGMTSVPSAADFVVFATAFAQVMGSLTAATLAAVGTLDVVPLIERARPILAAAVERPADAEPPGELAGRIELKRVRFRYAADGPFVLDDLDLTIEAGRFVALVGASGSGKSTIGRLILGFDRPEVGDVLLDGRSTERLDMAAVRRQVGTVLQSGRLSSGSIFDNICGDSGLGLEQAWEAAARAGVDRDIRAMPMGMHTVVPDGGGTLSGGQCQRILIARALVRRPRILFFDEATSALDNHTQAVVTETLTHTAVTRIVIAHRLSTVRAADRIFVLDRGRLVEAGTHDELMSRDGAFAALARRQLL